jgi:alanine-glyoxylate transaminase/serine-glyoxylate transaminase/serine-pyruvate transaminase
LRLTMKQLPRHKLMIPGPVEVSDSVLAEMGAQVAVHYGPEWTAFYKETTSIMKSVFRTEGDVFLLVCSGSGGMEAAISSLFMPGERVLVGVNGFFGERAAFIALSRGLQVVRISAADGTPITPDSVKHALESESNLAGVVIVHHETSTGVLNPIQAIGALTREFDIPFIVDAVSSLGGDQLAMDEWGIDICVTASQKCLEAPPGLAPVAVSPRAWEFMDRKGDFPAGWYLNLRTWREFADKWGDWHPFPITQATNNVRALRTALDGLDLEGLDNRIKRYRETARYIRSGLQEMDFALFVDGEYSSSTISAVCARDDLQVSEMITFLRDQKGIRIAGGLGSTSGRIFRVGHMGKAASKEYADQFLDSLAQYIRSIKGSR